MDYFEFYPKEYITIFSLPLADSNKIFFKTSHTCLKMKTLDELCMRIKNKNIEHDMTQNFYYAYVYSSPYEGLEETCRKFEAFTDTNLILYDLDRIYTTLKKTALNFYFDTIKRINTKLLKK